METDKAETLATFRKLTLMLGLSLPAEREQAIFEGFLGLRKMAESLRRPRTAASEPAGTFDASTIGRGN